MPCYKFGSCRGCKNDLRRAKVGYTTLVTLARLCAIKVAGPREYNYRHILALTAHEGREKLKIAASKSEVYILYAKSASHFLKVTRPYRLQLSFTLSPKLLPNVCLQPLNDCVQHGYSL